MEQLTAFEWQVKEIAEGLEQVGGCVFGERLASHRHPRAVLQRHSFCGRKSLAIWTMMLLWKQLALTAIWMFMSLL